MLVKLTWRLHGVRITCSEEVECESTAQAIINKVGELLADPNARIARFEAETVEK